MVIGKFATEDGITIFRLNGKLISSTLDKLKTAVDDALGDGGGKIVLNLRQVNIMDSVTVGLFISRFKTAKKKKGSLKFCELQPAVKKLFSMADLDKWLEIYNMENEALTAIRSENNSKE
ncbi:MAG: STAS domain-containing protein [Nitrospinae bacterium]|nr:STAS domain-containing protein [Nitrospinota bacterium]